MKNYIKFLEETKVNQLYNEINDITFYKWNNNFKISFTLACKSNHLQPLINKGINIDFSNKRVGMCLNQKTIKGTGNDISVNCKCDLKTFKEVSKFFRKDFNSNLLNDHNLTLLNFPFTPKKIKSTNEIIFKSDKINALISKIKRNVHTRKYTKEVYNLPIMQKVLNK